MYVYVCIYMYTYTYSLRIRHTKFFEAVAEGKI
jgi:hypothetical protein